MNFHMLRVARKAAKVTQEDLAGVLGVNRATISKYETGQIEPSLSQLQIIADKLNINLLDLIGLGDELDQYQVDITPSQNAKLPQNLREIYDDLSVSGKAEFLARLNDVLLPNAKEAPSDLTEEALKVAKDYIALSDHGKGAVKAILEYESKGAARTEQPDQMLPIAPMPRAKKRRDGFMEIKVYDQPAAAGLGNYLDDPDYHIEQYPAEVIHDDTDFGIIITGDSMEPKVHDGGTVFVQAAPSIDPGKIGIFVLNGLSYCKKLVVDHENRQIRLASINKAYDDIIITEFDEFRTIGRVLGQWTKGYKQDLFGW